MFLWKKHYVFLSLKQLKIFNALEKKLYLKLSSNLILRKSERFIDMKNWIKNHELGQLFHVNVAYYYGIIHKILEG